MKKLILSIALLFSISGILAQTFEVDTISMTGDIEDRINMVFLSDGYQEHELDKFIADVNWMMNAIFDREPYPAYRNYFNVFAIKVPSEVSGAADDPSSLINNYFGSTFNWANIWRLVVPAHSGKVQSVLRENFPEYDQVMMLVNDNRYGGSGGWISTNTTHTDGPEICIHEMGHSFASLGDEYWAGAQYAREKVNMTQESNPEEVKWARWIGYRSTGVYAHSESPSWYRPHQNCQMRYLKRQFCPVCQEAINSKILNLTSPIKSYFPEEDEFTNTEPVMQFKLDLLKPDPNTLKIVWSLNSDSIQGNVDSLYIPASELLPGMNRVSVSILDTTKYIRSSTHERIHLNRITWDFDSGSSGIKPDIRKSKFNLDLYPNPASDFINLEYYVSNPTTIQVNLLDLAGKKHELVSIQHQIAGSHQEHVNLSQFNLSKGTYLIEVITAIERIVLPLVIQ